MINVNVTTATRVGLNMLALLGAVVALFLGQSLFIPLVIAVLLAAMLWPAAQWLNQRCRLRWSVACLVVVAGIVLLNVAVTLGLLLATASLIYELPDTTTEEGQRKLYKSIRNPLLSVFPASFIEEYFPDPDKPSLTLDELLRLPQFWRVQAVLAYNPWAGPPAIEIATTVPLIREFQVRRNEPLPAEPVLKTWRDSVLFKFAKEALSLEKPYLIGSLLTSLRYLNNWAWQVVLIMFILLFLLMEGRMLSRRVVEIFGPSEHAQSKAVVALVDMARQVRVYLVWRTIINIGMAVVVGMVYFAVGLKQAWTWALLTAILCYIPYLGPIVAGVPPVFDAFLNCPSPWWVLGIVTFYLAVITVEGYLVVPVVMGRSLELNATTVMLACLFWELVWGMPGLFLAMPLMAAMKTVCFYVPGWEPWANLMSTHETHLEPERVALLRAVTLADTDLLPNDIAQVQPVQTKSAVK